jgi:hypothetical protein
LFGLKVYGGVLDFIEFRHVVVLEGRLSGMACSAIGHATLYKDVNPLAGSVVRAAPFGLSRSPRRLRLCPAAPYGSLRYWLAGRRLRRKPRE